MSMDFHWNNLEYKFEWCAYKVVLNFALCQKFQYFILCSLFFQSEIKINVGISAIFLRQTLLANLPPSWGRISCSYVRNQFNFYLCLNTIRFLCYKLIFWHWVENFYAGWALTHGKYKRWLAHIWGWRPLTLQLLSWQPLEKMETSPDRQSGQTKLPPLAWQETPFADGETAWKTPLITQWRSSKEQTMGGAWAHKGIWAWLNCSPLSQCLGGGARLEVWLGWPPAPCFFPNCLLCSIYSALPRCGALLAVAIGATLACAASQWMLIMLPGILVVTFWPPLSLSFLFPSLLNFLSLSLSTYPSLPINSYSDIIFVSFVLDFAQ